MIGIGRILALFFACAAVSAIATGADDKQGDKKQGAGKPTKGSSQALSPRSKSSKPASKKTAARPVAKRPNTNPPIGKERVVENTTSPAVASPEVPPGSVLLRYKFAPGEIVRWNVTQSLKVNTTILETTQRAQSGSKSIKAWEATTVEAGGRTTFVHRVEAVEMWQKQSGRAEIRFDSRSKDPPPAPFAEVAGATGVPLAEITIDSLGRIVRRNEMRGGHAKARDSQVLPPLPEEPVSVGSSWKQPDEITVTAAGSEEGSGPATRKIGLQQRYTVKAIAGDVATIEIRTEVLTPLENAAVQSQIVQELINGEFDFSISRGRVLRRKTTVDETVVGFQGQSSRMSLQIELEETLAEAAGESPATTPDSAPPAAAPKSDAATGGVSQN